MLTGDQYIVASFILIVLGHEEREAEAEAMQLLIEEEPLTPADRAMVIAALLRYGNIMHSLRDRADSLAVTAEGLTPTLTPTPP